MLLFLVGTGLILPCYGEENDEVKDKRQKVTMEEIVVKEKQESGFVETKSTQPYVESTIAKEGIKILGGPSQTSVDKTIELFPSVNVESIDPYGLNRQGRYIRIRGQGNNAHAYTMEGIPLDTGTRFGPRENSFDMENFSNITLYRGAVPADQGFSWGNYAGAVDIHLLKPFDKPGFTLTESVGTFNFNRTFVRADTGQILPGFKSFLSYSYTTADKWRGSGGVEREHITFGTVFSPSPVVNAQLFFDYQKGESDNYRNLSYAQAKDLSTYYRYDFNSSLTGNSRQDAYYYEFNKIDDEYIFLHGNLQIKPADNHTLTIKPYFSRDNILNIDTVANFSGSPGVKEWRSDRTKYGVIIDYKTRFFDTDLSVGYWLEMFKWPAYTAKVYRVSSTGALTFAGWQKQLLKYDGYFRWDSPYIMLSKTIGKLNATAGLKYFRFIQPKTIAYVNTSVSDVSMDDFSDYARIDSAACVGGKSTDVFLPSVAFSYALNDHVTPYFNYGRGYDLAYFGPGGIINGYWGNRAKFDAAGITADMLADRQDIPIGDNFDLGMRLKFGTLHITPTIFYSKFKDKDVTIQDPATGIQYRQTVGKAEAYGAELEIAGNLFDGMSIFASGTYNRSKFTKNVPSSSGTTDITGNQFPDTPEYMAKLGIIYTPHFLPDFQISPVIRYVGSRYGDATNYEKISGYSTMDVSMAYKLKNISSVLKDLTLGVSITNVFNSKYIASISAADEARQTGATYYPGAPFTVACSITGRF